MGPQNKTLIPALTSTLGVVYTPFMFFNQKGKLIRRQVFNPLGTPCFSSFLKKLLQACKPDLTSSRNETVAYHGSSGRFTHVWSGTELYPLIMDSRLRPSWAVVFAVFGAICIVECHTRENGLHLLMTSFSRAPAM